MKCLKQLTLLLIVFALLIGSTPVALAQEARDNQDASGRVFLPMVGVQNTSGAAEGGVLIEEVSVADQEAALAFWTHERIAAAGAMPLMAQPGPAEVDAAALAAPRVAGPGGYRAPGRAAADADRVARAAYAADWAAVELDDAALEAGLAAEAADLPEDTREVDGTSQIYTSYIANWIAALQTQYPHRWVGRFSFVTPAGTRYCSATAISNNNIVLAAHCVYDTPVRNTFFTGKVFTPAYRNGNAPYGSFATTSCVVLNAWVALAGAYAINTWARHDVAVCKVGNNSAGQTLNNAVGFAGRTWGAGYIRHVFNLGYPFNNYNDVALVWPGLYLRLCSAETFQQTTDTRGMGCNWGGGISGGPWIDHTTLASPTAYGTNGYWPGRVSGYVTTVNSGIFIGTQNIYGPRFTAANIVPLCNQMAC